jgi:zinc protease
VKRFYLFCLALTVALVADPAWSKVALPTATEFVLENGLSVRVIERHQLPLFSLQLTFRAGSVFDPSGKEGLASLTSDMLMRGTPTRSDRQIADDVAFGGGTLSNSCDRVAAGLDGEFLVSQGQKAFEIVADLVRNSSLAASEFDKTRTLALGNLQSRHENPSLVANDAIWSSILAGSRYAHFTGGTGKSMETITRDDVVNFMKSRYTPDNGVLVVCGDVAVKDVRAWVKKYLGSWQGKASQESIDEPFAAVKGREVIVYDKPDATQTQIRIGAEGLPLNDPAFPALEVARTIYGGSFTSRLMDEIRVNRGLSYGASYRSASLKPGGVVFVTTFTKNATVGEVLDIILAEASQMQTQPVSDSELVHGVNYRGGTYPLDFETNDDLARVFTSMWLNALDRSYYEDYQERLKAVTPAQAMEASQKYFAKDHYILVLVGKADEIKTQVEKYGPVTVLPFSAE